MFVLLVFLIALAYWKHLIMFLLGVRVCVIWMLAVFHRPTLASTTYFWDEPDKVDVRAFGVAKMLGQARDEHGSSILTLNNTNFKFTLRCLGHSPVEWVLNFEDDRVQNAVNLRDSYLWPRNFHRARNMPDTRKESSFWAAPNNRGANSFYTDIELGYERLKYNKEEAFVCRAVDDHANHQVMKLWSNLTAGTVQLGRRSTWDTLLEESLRPSDVNSSDCPVTFQVTQTPTAYFWKCVGHPDHPSQRATIEFHPCESSSYCANTYRSLKLPPSCVTRIDRLTEAQLSGDNSWHRRTPRNGAGVATCDIYFVHAGKRAPLVGANPSVEYFFVHNETLSIPALHFSTVDILMSDLIWFEPPIDASRVLYTEESLESTCFVSRYGFADYRRLQVFLNETEVVVVDEQGAGIQFNSLNEESNAYASSKLVLHFQHYGPGQYRVQCEAHVWNTTDIAAQTRTLEVRRVTPPSFETDLENVTYQEGDTARRLVCDVNGDPPPKISWVYKLVPGVDVDGKDLLFATVSAEWNNNMRVECTGTNRFGHSATKSFKIHVPKSSSQPISTTTIAAIVVGVLIALTLTVTLIYTCWGFWSLRRAVVSYLTDKEVKEFRDGNGKCNLSPAAEGKVPTGEDFGRGLAIDSLPYDSSFEVSQEHFTVDLDKELGSGQFGVVYSGCIKKAGPETAVAVKTVRPNVPIEYFKALLSELKIMAHVGHHSHIVQLIGAYTSEIKDRVLYVGVELCKCSLLQHLRDWQCQSAINGGYVEPKGHLAEEARGCDHEYQNEYSEPSTTCDSLQLVRWATEIATGMEFLSSKRVVHGDLAARNVLLSVDLTAKICDFGLSRQLVDYTYIKNRGTSCKLPMKWLALESLTKLRFSTKSDVWGYGVTCWEIFTLGNVPYSGTDWSWDQFVEQLEAGRRLLKPERATQPMYSKLLECWAEDPRDRPNFTELTKFWKNQEHKATKFG